MRRQDGPFCWTPVFKVFEQVGCTISDRLCASAGSLAALARAPHVPTKASTNRAGSFLFCLDLRWPTAISNLLQTTTARWRNGSYSTQTYHYVPRGRALSGPSGDHRRCVRVGIGPYLDSCCVWFFLYISLL